MESFETLPVDTSFWAHGMVSFADFDVTTPTKSLSIGDTPVGGKFAIDGAIYLRNTNNPTMTFAFDEQQTAFGLSIVDWDGGSPPGTPSFSTNATTPVPIVEGPQENGTVLFLGL
jgi:hypothetical protein